ncbi:MAG: undecaprenyl-diphosphate phosphatase [Rhodospirillaceae bacterium]|nr:undecaprenyl-diphosphate phosphatase [Rhodospirillaceae bacterium]
MPNIDILVLALVQGITEFLPISSSGHLILVPQLFCWPDQGLTLDVAAHVGTLLAVLVYFWRDVGSMAGGMVRLAQGKRDARARLVWLLLVASVPALLIGFVLDTWVGDALRDYRVIAGTLIGFGILLFLADHFGLTVRRMEHMTARSALIIGIFQCLAFIPGTSRSGITMTMARFMGYERQEAARFSFLLSIPTISAAGLYKGLQLIQQGSTAEIERAMMMTGFSAVAGFFAIVFMMYWLRRASFAPFVIYRILLGCLLYFGLYAGWSAGCG